MNQLNLIINTLQNCSTFQPKNYYEIDKALAAALELREKLAKPKIDPQYFKEYLKAFSDTSLQIYEQAPGKVSIGAIKWDKKYRVSVTVNTEFEAKEVRQLIEAAPFLYSALVDLPQSLGTTDDELYAWQCQAQDAMDKARGVK